MLLNKAPYTNKVDGLLTKRFTHRQKKTSFCLALQKNVSDKNVSTKAVTERLELICIVVPIFGSPKQ